MILSGVTNVFCGTKSKDEDALNKQRHTFTEFESPCCCASVLVERCLQRDVFSQTVLHGISRSLGAIVHAEL